MMKIFELFQNMGYKKSWAEIFLILYQSGSKPASTIAKLINKERTNTYKTLQEMSKEGLVAETNKGGTKYFFIANKEVLNNIIQQRKDELKQQESLANIVDLELDQLNKTNKNNKPFIRFFEGTNGIENAFQDILGTLSNKGYKMIKIIASNTLEEKNFQHKCFLDFSDDFFKLLKQKNIYSEIYLGNGIMTLEKLSKTSDREILKNLPAGDSSTIMILVGEILYTFFFKTIPTCIKIEEKNYANLLHFLLSNTKTE